ncbi:MAG: phosphoribosylformylglycinamidine synthase I [Candidatus Shapirobacteria bacterium]|nr:phosphoribosylformylglycinamidine synthase I [Candidatus Shapirobacteria bacterium]
MKKVKILVFSGYGLNCEEETKFAFDLAGGEADIVHINDLIKGIKKIDDYKILAFPGGFSYGDDTGSGNAFAGKIRNHLWNDIKKFIDNGGLIIGICNGFQILTRLGLLPALNGSYGKAQVELLHNKTARYVTRWVDLQVENNSPWLKGLNGFSAAIAHGEGRFYADEKVLSEIKKKKLVALKYIKGEICSYQNLEANPNGAIDDIAGITDETGRVFGLMPHPERAIFSSQSPIWSWLKEKSLRDGKKIPEYNLALQIFKNAVKYFNKKLLK